MDDRLETLEVKVAFQEHTIAQLDEVVRELAEKVEVLQEQLRSLREEYNANQPAPIDEKPPHY